MLTTTILFCSFLVALGIVAFWPRRKLTLAEEVVQGVTDWRGYNPVIPDRRYRQKRFFADSFNWR